MRFTRVGSVNERLLGRFSIDPESGCWNFLGAKDAQGYGRISGELRYGNESKQVRNYLAHRAMWVIHNGWIRESPEFHGRVVMHICDNPSCVNPTHLRLGSQSDNVKDMVDKGRKVAGEWQRRKGVEHFRSAFKDQADIDLICSTVGKTKELAERFGVAQSTIKRIRRRNGVVRDDAEKFVNKPLSDEDIAFIRSTPPGTRGLAKRFGVGKTTIANIRKGLTHAR